jgi:protein associated with RNAse G/E
MHEDKLAISVIKCNLQGEEVWRYTGRILSRTSHGILLEATFDREEVELEGLLLTRGDRFVELYLQKCWYNIYEINDGVDHHLKGWYCNITYPPSISVDSISYVDLALDLVVFPDGHQSVLDREEFAALKLESDDRHKVIAALEELQKCFRNVDLVSLERWASQGGCSSCMG